MDSESAILLEDYRDGVLIDAALPIPGPQGVIMLADDSDWPVRQVVATDLFESNCLLLFDETIGGLYPVNVYETDDYYCRAGITINIDAADPSPLLASLTSSTQMMGVYIQASVCGELVPGVVGTIDEIEPPQLFPCGVAVFKSPVGGVLMLIDGDKVVFPMRIYLTLAAEGFTRSGYLQFRVGPV